MSLLKLFFIFAKIGAVLLGGGYVILPVLQNEFIEKRQLLTDDELIDFFALSQSLPGLIAANISMFIGYKLRNKRGAFVAMVGVTTVPFLCIVLLASFLGLLTQNNFVQGALWGVGVAVIALIMLTVREMYQKSNKTPFFYVVYVMALCSLLFIKLSPIQVIIIFSLAGVFYKRLVRAKNDIH